MHELHNKGGSENQSHESFLLGNSWYFTGIIFFFLYSPLTVFRVIEENGDTSNFTQNQDLNQVSNCILPDTVLLDYTSIN